MRVLFFKEPVFVPQPLLVQKCRSLFLPFSLRTLLEFWEQHRKHLPGELSGLVNHEGIQACAFGLLCISAFAHVVKRFIPFTGLFFRYGGPKESQHQS
jgi:hypothetical protein